MVRPDADGTDPLVTEVGQRGKLLVERGVQMFVGVVDVDDVHPVQPHPGQAALQSPQHTVRRVVEAADQCVRHREAARLQVRSTLTGENRHDVTQFLHLLDAVTPIRGRRGRPRRKPRRVYADRGYDFDKYRRLLRERGIKPIVARRGVS